MLTLIRIAGPHSYPSPYCKTVYRFSRVLVVVLGNIVPFFTSPQTLRKVLGTRRGKLTKKRKIEKKLGLDAFRGFLKIFNKLADFFLVNRC